LAYPLYTLLGTVLLTMDIKEVKQQITNNVKFETIDPPKPGGQSCGITYSRLRLYSEELDLTIETGYHHNVLKNKELLLTLFELVLDDLVR
jgi:hypothetical protein